MKIRHPLKATKLGNSFPNNSLEELALQTKSVTRLTTNFGINTCKLCKALKKEKVG